MAEGKTKETLAEDKDGSRKKHPAPVPWCTGSGNGMGNKDIWKSYDIP